MVLDERIGAVESALEAHDLRISALEDRSALIAELLTEIRDDVRASRGRLDRLIQACTAAVMLVAQAIERAIEVAGHRLIVGLLLAIAGLLSALLGDGCI